jgi:predicted ribosomally synthesized peptide with SipW-like signal peptide
MKSKKIIMTVLVVTIIGALAVGGTAAYFTDGEEKVNTFTVGDMDITLTESEWDDSSDGKSLVPGYETGKNPTVTAVEGDSYMRMTVEFVSNDNSEMTAARAEKILKTICFEGEQGVNDELFVEDAARSNTSKRCYVYNGVFKENSTAVLFDTVRIPSQWNQADVAVLGEYKIVVKAEAIQSANFNSAQEAFEALDGEIESGTAVNDYKTVDGK